MGLNHRTVIFNHALYQLSYLGLTDYECIEGLSGFNRDQSFPAPGRWSAFIAHVCSVMGSIG
jgi:hypothetical protein